MVRYLEKDPRGRVVPYRTGDNLVLAPLSNTVSVSMKKRCGKCHRLKAAHCFYRGPSKLGGLRSYCKKCDGKVNRAYRGHYRQWSLKKLYGMSLADYDALYHKQGGRCAVCSRRPQPGGALQVDHDHKCCDGTKSCGRCIRGLLCIKCNVGLGALLDNIRLMWRAIAYLKGYQQCQPYAS